MAELSWLGNLWDSLTKREETPRQPGYSYKYGTAMPKDAGEGSFSSMSPVEKAAITTSAIPVVGDVAGLLADIEMYKTDPSSRNPLNYGLSAIGLIPFVPSAGILKKYNVGESGFDPRFDPRVKEQERLKSLTKEVDVKETQDVPKISIFDLEGQPFVTSMSDRTQAGGLLTKINDVELSNPVNLQGGQGYMFENPGQVWASDVKPVKAIMKEAERVKAQTGLDPVYLPWRMAPSGGDFASMTGESMLAYSSANMTKKAKKSLDKAIKQHIPDWKGVDNPESIEQFRSVSGEKRKLIQKQVIDKNFRDAGGLSLGEARLSVSDPEQLLAKEGGLFNVGRIHPDQPIIHDSGHPSYSHGVPGEGLGRLKEDIMVHELLPSVVAERRILDPRNPARTDIRSMQMGPYGGILTEGLLRKIEASR